MFKGSLLRRLSVVSDVSQALQEVDEEDENRNRPKKMSIISPFNNMTVSTFHDSKNEPSKVTSTRKFPSKGYHHQENCFSSKQHRNKIGKNLLQSKAFQILILVSTLIALFGTDVFTAFIPSENGMLIEALLFGIMILFTFELFVNILCTDRYIGSFFFWIDFIGLLSLLPDIGFLWVLIVQEETNNDQIAILRAGRIIRTGTRTTRALRFLKLLRFARMMRLFRVFRFVRSYILRRELSRNSSVSQQAPSKLGLRLADSLGKRVIVGMIILLFAVPNLDVFVPNTSGMDGLTMLEVLANHSSDVAAVDYTVEQYISSQPSMKILVVSGQTFLNVSTDGARSLELAATDYSYAVFDLTDIVEEQAVLNILLTLLLIILIGLSSLLFNRDVSKAVVQPIIKTTKVIRKLAKTLFLLSKSDWDEDVDDTELLEGDFIETIVSQLNRFFTTDAKTEPIKEKRRGTIVPADIPDIDEMAEEFVIDSPRALIKESRIKCMASFDNFFEDVQARQFFKVFLTSEYAVESLLFILAVDQYKLMFESLKLLHDEIVNLYVLETSVAQVNISDTKRGNLLAQDPEKLTVDRFEESRIEIFKQLERDNYPRFKKSELAKELINMKKARLKEYLILKNENEK